MKISYSDLKNAYARLSAIDTNAVLANLRNVSLADIKIIPQISVAKY